MSASGKTSVIVLMHNNIAMTQDCLGHLAEAVQDLDHEVILLDNASSEDTRPIFGCAGMFRDFHIIRASQNTVFSAANNMGAADSLGDWLLFLNNDAIVKRNSVKQLLDPFCRDRMIGITGGKLLYPGERAVQHAGICQMLWDHPSNYGVGATPADPRINSRGDRFAVSGAMLCISKEAFKAVGGFDERYVWGTEDIDLCLKVRAAGWRVVYCPEAVAVHRESATLRVNRVGDPSGNCRLYRRLWDHILTPVEQAYVQRMKEQGIRSVAVFGTGSAARGLSKILSKNKIEIDFYTSSQTQPAGTRFLGKPVLSLDQVHCAPFDRLMVASQSFFEVEASICDLDPKGEPIYPILR